MAFLARNLLFGQEATSASSAEEEIAPTPLPDTRREPCAREGCEKRATRTLQTRRNPPQSRGGGRKGSYTGDSRSRDERGGGGRTGRHLGGCGAHATRGALPNASATRGTPPIRRRRHPGHASARASRPPGTRRLPTPPLPGTRRLPAPSQPGARRHLGVLLSGAHRFPAPSQPGARRLPKPPLPGAPRFPAPSNTGSTPRSFPRCSPCRGRPGSPACRRCGTAGSRSAP